VISKPQIAPKNLAYGGISHLFYITGAQQGMRRRKSTVRQRSTADKHFKEANNPPLSIKIDGKSGFA
jgi:hypothetical protein